jgi:hypothetical protein
MFFMYFKKCYMCWKVLSSIWKARHSLAFHEIPGSPNLLASNLLHTLFFVSIQNHVSGGTLNNEVSKVETDTCWNCNLNSNKRMYCGWTHMKRRMDLIWTGISNVVFKCGGNNHHICTEDLSSLVWVVSKIWHNIIWIFIYKSCGFFNCCYCWSISETLDIKLLIVVSLQITNINKITCQVPFTGCNTLVVLSSTAYSDQDC